MEYGYPNALSVELDSTNHFSDNALFYLKESYRSELSSMVEKGHRVEIEALYCHGYDFLGKYIATKIVQSDYI